MQLAAKTPRGFSQGFCSISGGTQSAVRAEDAFPAVAVSSLETAGVEDKYCPLG